MTINFEGKDRRINVINNELPKYGIKNLEEAYEICQQNGIDVNEKIKAIQPIAFGKSLENRNPSHSHRRKKSSPLHRKNKRACAKHRLQIPLAYRRRQRG